MADDSSEENAEISVADLGWLLCCAVRYNARIPYGVVPGRIWTKLSPEWQRRVNEAAEEEYNQEH